MCRMKSYGKTLVCLAAAALLVCLFSGCSSLRKVKDIKVTSCGLESYSMQGLRSLSAVLALGIDNPAMSFTVTSLDGVIKYNGEDFATYTTTGQVEVDGRCTFFMVGNTVARSEESKAEVKRMAEEGFEVANHSYAHKYYNKLSSQEVIDDVLKCNQAIKDVCGVEPTVFRLPGGIMTDAVRNSVKMPIISWSIDTLDWKTREAAATINAVLGEDVHVQDGDIILMHELYVSTGEASKVIIQTLTNLGFQLVTVSELIQYRSGGLIEPGKQYGHFYLSDLPPEMLQAPAEGESAESTPEETFPTDGAVPESTEESSAESLPAESTASL